MTMPANGIDDHLRHAQELGVKRHVKDRQRHEMRKQEQRTVHRHSGRHHPNRRADA